MTAIDAGATKVSCEIPLGRVCQVKISSQQDFDTLLNGGYCDNDDVHLDIEVSVDVKGTKTFKFPSRDRPNLTSIAIVGLEKSAEGEEAGGEEAVQYTSIALSSLPATLFDFRGASRVSLRQIALMGNHKNIHDASALKTDGAASSVALNHVSIKGFANGVWALGGEISIYDSSITADLRTGYIRDGTLTARSNQLNGEYGFILDNSRFAFRDNTFSNLVALTSRANDRLLGISNTFKRPVGSSFSTLFFFRSQSSPHGRIIDNNIQGDITLYAGEEIGASLPQNMIIGE